jgi:hypothetical protein
MSQSFLKNTIEAICQAVSMGVTMENKNLAILSNLYLINLTIKARFLTPLIALSIQF